MCANANVNASAREPGTETSSRSPSPTTQERRIGSLLRLFQSEFFDLWMCVVYMRRYRDHKGVFSYLCHELYKFPQEQVEFFLPQMVFLLVRFPDVFHDLERFIVDRCATSTHFALRVTWMLFSCDPHLSPELKANAIRIRDLVEIVCVNMNQPGQQSSMDINNSPLIQLSIQAAAPRDTACSQASVSSVCSAGKELTPNNREHGAEDAAMGRVYPREDSAVVVSIDAVSPTELSLRHALIKSERADFFVNENKFLRFLVELSTNLRSVDLQQRNEVLQEKLMKLNGILPPRLYLPLYDSNKPFCEILRIVPECCFVLKSRERVPYMMVVEVANRGHPCADPISFISEHGVSDEFSSNFGRNLQGLKGPSVRRRSSFSNGNADGSDHPHHSHSRSATVGGSTKHLSLFQNEEHAADAGSRFSLSYSASDLEYLTTFQGVPEVVRNPVVGPFSDTWLERKHRMRLESPFRFEPGWDMLSVIVKAGDDIRQEELAQQLISQFALIFASAKLPLWLKPYKVLAITAEAGFVETITDAVSIDQMKKSIPNFVSLKGYFEELYGKGTMNLRQAQRNFVESMAGYSILCYLLQIKDRHNGNILMDKEGHVIHIDFGFMLSRSPGNINFEGEGFKLSAEFVELMDGVESDLFNYFRVLLLRGFLECRKHMDRVVSIVELMIPDKSMPCFSKDGGTETVEELRQRFNLGLPEANFIEWVNNLIDDSIENWRTRQYDNFQRLTNGIL
eukprot:ANDGO_08058.mRNA.1 Phosphatidylinositol 4-kinase beta 1